MKRDQKFFDMYSVVIGALAIFAVGIFVLAMKMSDMTQGQYTASTEELRADVDDRLRPFAQVTLPGQEGAAADHPAQPAETAEPVATTLSGPQVYNDACNVCHGAGIGGAPKLGDTDNWAPRIAQGTETLHKHAIEGFTGEAGFMPAKGGKVSLSDEEVAAAVDFMISESGG